MSGSILEKTQNAQPSGMYGYNGETFVLLNTDKSTRALSSITYEHHETHAGYHYEMIDVVDLAINNVRDLRITTPNTTKWAHLTFTIAVESETDVYLYEVVTIDTVGTAITPINNNRNSANTSGLAFDYIDNTSTANANADTGLGGATTLERLIIGAGKDSGGTSRGREFILKQNTIYDFRFIASVAGYVNYNLQWYEHTDKN